jgi:hypothetical protein
MNLLHKAVTADNQYIGELCKLIAPSATGEPLFGIIKGCLSGTAFVYPLDKIISLSSGSIAVSNEELTDLQIFEQNADGEYLVIDENGSEPLRLSRKPQADVQSQQGPSQGNWQERLKYMEPAQTEYPESARFNTQEQFGNSKPMPSQYHNPFLQQDSKLLQEQPPYEAFHSKNPESEPINAPERHAPYKSAPLQYENPYLQENAVQEQYQYSQALQTKYPDLPRINAQEQFAPYKPMPQYSLQYENAEQLEAHNDLNSSRETEHLFSQEIAMKKDELQQLESSIQREREALSQLLAQKESLLSEISALRIECDNMKLSAHHNGSSESASFEELFGQSKSGVSNEASEKKESKNLLNADIILGKRSDYSIASEDKAASEQGARIVFDVNSLDTDLQDLALELSKLS